MIAPTKSAPGISGTEGADTDKGATLDQPAPGSPSRTLTIVRDAALSRSSHRLQRYRSGANPDSSGSRGAFGRAAESVVQQPDSVPECGRAWH